MAISFRDSRFDPDLMPIHPMAVEMANVVGYTAKMSIDTHLAQLLRLRVAQLLPCSYCLILHTQNAHDKGIAPEKVANLPSWRESGLFNAAERAALAYCEALTIYNLTTFAAAHDALTGHFDSQQIADIASLVINMNVWTRLKLAHGATPVES